MIDEAVGKILGMAMAYGVSALGLFLAYANYRRRTLGADRVMTPRAWSVLGAVSVLLAAGVLVVVRLAEPAPVQVSETVMAPAPPPAAAAPAEPAAERARWPLVGMLLPAAIFLFATWVTVAIYRRFTRGTG